MCKPAARLSSLPKCPTRSAFQMLEHERNSHAGHSTGQLPDLKQHLDMDWAQVCNDNLKQSFVQHINDSDVMPSNKGTHREAWSKTPHNLK